MFTMLIEISKPTVNLIPEEAKAKLSEIVLPFMRAGVMAIDEDEFEGSVKITVNERFISDIISAMIAPSVAMIGTIAAAHMIGESFGKSIAKIMKRYNISTVTEVKPIDNKESSSEGMC